MNPTMLYMTTPPVQNVPRFEAKLHDVRTSCRDVTSRFVSVAVADNRSGSRFACVPANIYCFSGVFGDLQGLGLNMYDVRKKCDKSEDKDGPVGLFSYPCLDLG